MSSPDNKVFFADFVFRFPAEVYEPAEDSFLFAENLKVRDTSKVVDIGTGSGFLGIVAARNARMVVATDINPFAVLCARENARINKVVDHMFFVQGDLFCPLRIEKEFDLIMFNAPYLPSEETEKDSWLRRAWAGGVSGREIIDRFILEAPKYLKPRGEILLMQSTLSNVRETLQRFETNGYKTEIVAHQDLPFFESIVLIRAGVNASMPSCRHQS